MKSASLSSEPSHLTVAMGTPEFVASWPEVLVAPRTPECSCHKGHQCNMNRSPWCAPCLTHCTSFLQTLSYLTQAHLLQSLVSPLFSLFPPYLELFLTFFLFLKSFTSSRRLLSPASFMKLLFARLLHVYACCFKEESLSPPRRCSVCHVW